MKKILNIKGESLLEIIISFVIFAMGLTIAGMILGSALRNMQNAKNRVVAVNIAREGIEAVRNIRDTNWLKFHSKKRLCWNQAPTRNPNEQCDGNNPIKPGSYTIYRQGSFPNPTSDLTYRWMLGELDWEVPLETDTPPVCGSVNDYYKNTITNKTYKCVYDGTQKIWVDMSNLSLVDVDPMVDSDGDSDYTNDKDLYNHANVHPEEYTLGTVVKDTIFSRVITIKYIRNDGVIIDDLALYNSDINRMEVTSTVSWQTGGRIFKVELVTHITDYLGREKLSG